MRNGIPRLIAYYLPQFHPIPENDEWWGKGFTEWTNLAKAKPLFRGHYQPHLPADLGFYDLRVAETRAAQAEMAREHGIEGFCYWHYWFAGEQVLERPFQEVLKSGEPRFPFCLAWANESWTGIWHGASGRVLKQQTYPGLHDHKAHFFALLDAFTDDRYMTVDGKPILVIYRPKQLPEARTVTDYWRELAHESGLKGLYLIGVELDETSDLERDGFDSITASNLLLGLRVGRVESLFRGLLSKRPMYGIRRRILRRPMYLYRYDQLSPLLSRTETPGIDSYPCIVPNWDNTPRCGADGLVLHGSNPELFRRQVQEAIRQVDHLSDERKIIFVKSWNEWAEGNHLEPDQKFGTGYLQVLKEEVRLTHSGSAEPRQRVEGR